MASEKDHLDAVVALLTAGGAEPMTLQQLADADALPTYYTEVQVMQRAASGPRRTGAAPETTQWRVLTRAVAQRYGNAQTLRAKTYAALHEAALTVGGEPFVIEHAASDDPIGPDDGWFSGTSEFAY